MNAITQITTAHLTMSSKEIAELVDSRHDKVKQSIERLAQRGVISQPPMGEVKVERERRTETVKVYNLGKRDSLIVVAQLCPEFTAHIVDRWQELEEQVAKPVLNPANLSRLQLIEIAMQAEQERLQLECKVEELAPKADALDRISTANGSLCLTDAAKALQLRPVDLIRWMQAHGWIYRRAGNANWTGYQNRIQDGNLEHKITVVSRDDGTEKVVEQVRITSRGIGRLAQSIRSDLAVMQ